MLLLYLIIAATTAGTMHEEVSYRRSQPPGLILGEGK